MEAKHILRQVEDSIFDLLNSGETEVVFGERLGESFKVYVKDMGTVEVSYAGNSVKVSLPSAVNRIKESLLARYIMQGFARIYLNKNESRNMNRKIRLTEGALRRIVKESVKKVLSERTRFEAGLSDDEVSRMRTNRFANDVDPHYGDSIYDDEQERYVDRMNGRRLSRHFATQKHKPNPLDTEVNEGSLRETKDPTAKMQALIQAANKAVMDAKSACEDNEPLMDREGETYGLSGEIRLDGRGFIIFPYTQSAYYEQSYSTPERIKVLTKKGGVMTVVNGDDFTPGWRDAQRELKRIIADAKRGIENFRGYDPNWEDSDSPEEFKANKKSLSDFNKKIGARAGRGSEFLNKNY